MTPAFMLKDDMLLRMQLRSLSEQSSKDFDVLMVDAHYSKRRGYIPELAERYKLSIIHVPYSPNQNVAKTLDCGIFNAPYCYSESPRIVRFSCWRFLAKDFTKACLESPTNVDFYFHSISPVREPATGHDSNNTTNHNTDVWSGTSDAINWPAVPKRAGDPGATWTFHSDVDTPPSIFPINAYGNYMVFRKDWLAINGCDDTWSSQSHYEDQDFCIRARNAGFQCSRSSGKLWRLHHHYGNHSGRANIAPDKQFKKCCPRCEQGRHVLEPRRFDIAARASRGEIDLLEDYGVWVCKTCFLCGPIYHTGCHEHLQGHVEKRRITQANIIPKYKIGRNLRILAADLDGKSLSEKVEIFERSYSDPKYYDQ